MYGSKPHFLLNNPGLYPVNASRNSLLGMNEGKLPD